MGAVADAFKRKAAAADKARAQLPRDAAEVLTASLESAVDSELYAVSPLPKTGRMRRAVTATISGQTVQAGFDAAKAPHARRRLEMKGTSKTGGHKLDLNLAPVAAREAAPKIKGLGSAAAKRIAEA